MSRGGRRGGGRAGRGGRPPRAPAAKAAPIPRGALQVDGYSEQWLSKGFPWVYPKEVVAGAPPREGEERLLVGPSGRALGRGLADAGWIAARVYRHDDGPLDAAWLDGVVDRALALRARLDDGRTTGWRLIHGENDGLPGIRVDRWADHLVVIADTPAVRPLLDPLLDALDARLHPQSVHLCYRPDPRDTRDLDGADPAPGLLRGRAPEAEVVVQERGIALHARPWDGPDVGIYADMRDVRAWLEPHWAGRRVLNLFAYTGAFSVAAAVHGAVQAVSVDLSGPYLARAEANLRLNGLSPDDHPLVEDDTFKALDRLRRTGERFDVVICDPPSFSHSKAGTWSAKKDLPRLVASAARVLDPGGWLVVASNQGQVSPREHRGQVADGLKKAGRWGREIAFLGAAADHPAAVTFPEGHYLKVGVWALD